MILRDASGTKQDVLAQQEAMLRLAERDYGLTLKRLEAETGIPAVSLNTYKRGTAMPVHVLVQLCRVIPDELTSLLFGSACKHIGTDEPGDGCFDSLTTEAVGFAADKLTREADGVVCHIDRAALSQRARRLASKARIAGRAA